MKPMIHIDITTKKIDPAKCKANLLVLGVFSDAERLDPVVRALDDRMNGRIGRLISMRDFTGKTGTDTVIYTDGHIAAERVVLVGLGPRKNATLHTARLAAAQAARKAIALKAASMVVATGRAFGSRFKGQSLGAATTEGVYLGGYLYDEFITTTENGRAESLEAVILEPDSGDSKSFVHGVARGGAVGWAQNYARTISNRPANVINPQGLAEAALEIASDSTCLTCSVLDEGQLTDKGMGGILAVGRGSSSPPRLIVLKYSPRRKKNGPLVGLVGKAVTFDSGGISIKPAKGMGQMKLDKSGGVAVIAVMAAADRMGLSTPLYGLVPAAENMPGGNSYRPGDIITTFSGKTVEIDNTDAEGRMLLCDALAYAEKLKCETIIDIATLTGSCMVALGQHMAGVMGNDQKLINQLLAASKHSGEKIWHLPSGEEYAEEMKGKITDLRNAGGRWGGACTAAAFLGQFVGKGRWAHLDIAGMDMLEKDTVFTCQGSAGFGVRLLTAFLSDMEKA